MTKADAEAADLGEPGAASLAKSRPMGAAYGAFVLTVLFLGNMLNWADRSILGALAEAIKHDLSITDAQVGFLYGTSFVALNGVMGLAMGAIVDSWLRNRLLMIGVGFWSLMTALSGASSSFAQLATARLGVGVGEATFAPLSHSLIADSFALQRRARAFAVLYCAPSIGVALCLSASGWLVEHWAGRCGAWGLCHVAGWQAAFFLFGFAGLVVALLSGLIRDPAQGVAAERRRNSRPLAAAGRELGTLLPPFTFAHAWRAGGVRALRANLILALAVAALGFALARVTGDVIQWAAVGVAAYALLTWAQSLRFGEAGVHRLTVGSGRSEEHTSELQSRL